MKKLILGLLIFWSISSCKSTFPDSNWVNKQWTLIEMQGVPVQTSNSPQDAHLIFSAGEKMMNGSGSCNRIFGPYEIGKRHSLTFGNIASTMMACQNQAFENTFLENLKAVQSYQLIGGELHLRDSRKRVILKLR
jgi:heat shock protein HslJ